MLDFKVVTTTYSFPRKQYFFEGKL